MKTGWMSKEQRKRWLEKSLLILAYLYLMLPFIIFIGGYCKPVIAIPVIIIVLISFFLAVKNTDTVVLPEINREAMFKIAIVAVIVINFIIIAGIGRGVWQNDDHTSRNNMFTQLVSYEWPVAICVGDGTTGALIYYIGFWLPAAIIGKLFGINMGYNAQVLWAFLGIMLVWFMICSRRKKIEVWPIIVFLFFGGLDYFIIQFFSETAPAFWMDNHLEYVAFYSSFATQLFWAFNQAIPTWVATMLLLHQKNRKNLVLILGAVMLNATLPFIGMIPIVLYLFFTNSRIKFALKNCLEFSREAFRDIFTFQNLLGGGVIGILSFLFLKNNESGQLVEVLSYENGTITNFTGYEGIKWAFARYCFVIFLEVGIYFWCVYKRQKKNSLYYLTMVMLIVIPFIRVGYAKDFAMRASIPFLVILVLYIIEQLGEYKREVINYILIGALAIGAITGVKEIHRTLWRTEAGVPTRADDSIHSVQGNFGGKADNFFYNTFCKDYRTKKFENVEIDYVHPSRYDEEIVWGPEFSVEANAPVADEISIIFDAVIAEDIYFYNKGMLDDSSVTTEIIVNDKTIGTIDYQRPYIKIPKEVFTDYTQKIIVKINKEVKMYAGDYFYLLKEEPEIAK